MMPRFADQLAIGFCLCLLIGTNSLAQAGCQNDQLSMMETALTREIQLELNIQSALTCSDLEKLTQLSTNGMTPNDIIYSLNGLQFAENLELLALNAAPLNRGHDVDNLSSLKHLSKLRTINLFGNGQELSLEPLGTVEGLEQLVFQNLTLTHTEVLGHLPNLQELTVINGIPLRHLQGLTDSQLEEVLNNYYQRVSFDIQNLTSSKSLQILGLHFLKIKNLSGLTLLTQLKTLSITNARLRSVPSLTTLDQLESLSLTNNYIQDLTSIEQNPGFGAGDEIDLSGNCLDLSPDSEATRIISVLEARGVNISAEGQRPQSECPQ
jgi:hypothetical protein